MIGSLKRRIPVVVLCAGIFLVGASIFTAYKSKKAFDDSAFWTEHTHAVILETQNVLLTIQDIQVGGRGFLITGDSGFLESVNISRGITSKAIARLRLLTNDNPNQGPRIDSVEHLSQNLLDFVTQYCTIRREKGFPEAQTLFATKLGKHYLDSIRNIIDRMQRVDYTLLRIRKEANETSRNLLYRQLIFLVSSQCLLILVIFFAIRHNVNVGDKTLASQALFKLIVQSSDDAIISTDLGGIITSWNRGAEHIFKFSAEEIIGKPITILIPKHLLSEEADVIARIEQNRAVDHYDTERLKKDGQPVNVSLTVSPIKDAKGKIIGASKIVRDITQRKINDDALNKSLKDISDYQYAMDESAIVAITDRKGIIKHVNKNFCKISKYSAEELIGQDHRIVNSGHHPKELIRDLWQTIGRGKIWKGELKNKDRDGGTYWVDTTIVPFLDASGKPYQYVAIRADITQRKRVEEENEKNEIRFQNTLNKMLEGVEILGFDCRYLYVNEAYERQVKYSKSELLGRTVMEKFPGIETTEIFKAIHRCLDERIAIQMEDKFTFSDLTTSWFEISFQPVPEGVFILSIDITEKKKSEEKIRYSEERFRSLIENSYEIVSISDAKFRPLYRSPASVRITGWTDEDREKVGATEHTHSEDIEKFGNLMKIVLNNPGVSFPASFRTQHKDGHYLFLEGVITNMLHNHLIGGIVSNFRDVTETRMAEQRIKESEKIYKTVASSIPGSVICLLDRDLRYFLIEGDLLETIGYSKEQLLGKKLSEVIPSQRLAEVLPNFKRVFAGESFQVENVREGLDIVNRYVPLRDESNQVFAAMVVLIDVSELKKTQRAIAELNADLEIKIKERTLELELVNKELESFSYSVAHDLRAPLRAVSGYATMLDEDYGAQFDSEGKRLITAVEHNAKKMGTLIDDLLAFSKLGRKPVQKSIVDMKELIKASLADIQIDAEHPAEIIIHDTHSIMADSSLMRHVMVNLLSNAVKYSSKKPKPVVEINSRQDNDRIEYSVKDNGVGFDMKYVDKLFGVFQRLHSDEEFDGTGVGLAIVHRIINRHGGKIWAKSEVGQGATFYFTLPLI